MKQQELPHIDPVEKAMQAVKNAPHGAKGKAWAKLREERHKQLRRELKASKARQRDKAAA